MFLPWECCRLRMSPPEGTRQTVVGVHGRMGRIATVAPPRRAQRTHGVKLMDVSRWDLSVISGSLRRWRSWRGSAMVDRSVFESDPGPQVLH